MKTISPRYNLDLSRYYRLPAVRVSLALVLSVFVVAIFISFAFRPTLVAIASLQKNITESQKTLKQLETKARALEIAAGQLEKLKPSLPSINTSIPNEGALYTPLTRDLENLAVGAGVVIESESLGPTLLFSRILSPFTPGKNQSVVSLPFAMRVSGNYPGINAYLTNLLQMERIIHLESVTINREAGSRSATGSVSMSVSGYAYYLADEAQLKKAIPEDKGK